MSTDVFISYRRSDRQWAERLRDALRRRGVSAWYDGMIGTGHDWRDEIVENIKRARVLVVLFSEAVNASTELKKELSVADESRTVIVVARIENVVPKGGYAYELGSRNFFDAFEDPARQLEEFADVVVDALARPEELRRRFSASAEELARRQRRRLLGHQGRLRDSTLLIVAFVVISAVQFVAYEGSASPVARYAAGQTPRLLTFLLVAGVVSLGSPLLLIQGLHRGLSGIGLLIVPCSLLNTAIMILLVRNLASTIWLWRQERRA
jgi:TIR domain-containing protein